MTLNGGAGKSRRCIAVVSPFLDKRHGTERATVECFSRLADEYQIVLYSQAVEGLDLGTMRWCRVPILPGPHLFNYLWWFAANHIWRWRDRAFRNLTPDLVFSPGVNCLDADVVYVHIVFAEFVRQVRSQLTLRQAVPWHWPRLLHRRIYYWLIIALEGVVYRRPDLSLGAVSRKVAGELASYYGRTDEIGVIYHGLDPEQFSPQRIATLHEGARRDLGLGGGEFAILLIGNDWKKKGLAYLIEAIGQIQDPSLRLLVVGRDDSAAFSKAIAQNGLADRVRFLPPRPDVEFYYAAADIYAGPSLEDAFALPPAEAMACGLPAIVSREAGVAEIITHGRDGLILEDPTDSVTLAGMIRQLRQQPTLRAEMGNAAALTARQYTWEKNAEQMRELFERVLAKKGMRGELRDSASTEGKAL